MFGCNFSVYISYYPFPSSLFNLSISVLFNDILGWTTVLGEPVVLCNRPEPAWCRHKPFIMNKVQSDILTEYVKKSRENDNIFIVSRLDRNCLDHVRPCVYIVCSLDCQVIKV